MDNQPWLVARPQPTARFRLFCFPYAGGNAASFMPWQSILGSGIHVCAVQLPARGTRYREKAITDFTTLLPSLSQHIGAHDDLPFAFFGHSLGALVAFEVAHRMAAEGLREPEHLFVSAANAPSSGTTRQQLEALDDDGVVERLRRYEGTPESVLQNRELMALLLPAIRGDFALLDSYRYQRRAPLSIPLTVLAGRLDTHVNEPGLAGWRQETRARFDQEWFEGGHFYLHDEQHALIKHLFTRLAPFLS